MKTDRFILLMFLSISCTSLEQNKNQVEGYELLAEKEVSPGVLWIQMKAKDIFSSKQVINILEIDLEKSEVRPMATALCKKVSELGSSQGAIAGVNGTFYASNCDSRSFLKVADKTYSFNQIRKEGSIAFLLSKDNRAHFQWLQTNEDPSSAYHGIGGFPQLLKDGNIKISPEEKTAFFSSRHPRTAVGIKSDKQVVIITVDGRSTKSKGFTILELAQFLKDYGVKEAMNLDGGVSTVMWLDGQGVVNTPSSSSGEMRVSDSLGVF